MKIASVAEIKSQFSAFVKASAEGPVVITRNGRPVAVLLGIQDEEEIERHLMAYSPRLRAILDRSRNQIGEGRSVPHEEFWKKIEGRQPKTPRAGRRAKGKSA